MDPQQGPPQSDIIIGQTVGNYLVTQKLGEGGMGSVYLAEHPTIGKKVALKVLHAEFSSNPEVAERFFTEAKSVNAIGHPNIVDIVDYGVIQTGPAGHDRLVYFIMEYLAGMTLSHVIRTESPLPPERALTIALQVADALAASHKTGIVHRDLKPDNIILIQRGREADFVKLLDFGIAKLTGDSLSSHKTRTGLVLGTPAYMSPEQCEGRANVDHRTDVYALGICLYEMLVGRVPFIGEGYGEILVQHLTQTPIPPSQYRMMSPHVEAVVMKALEKRVELRYPTMDEFMRAMADPVGYVESHGGVAGFTQRQLMPSVGALPPIRLTPAPLTMTPVPGMGQLLSPVPGMLQQPTTLSAAAGQVQPGRGKTGFLIAGVVVVAAAAAGVFFVLSNKSKDSGSAVTPGGSDTVVMGTGSADKGSAVVAPDKGSAAVAPDKGSAAVAPDKGSAATPDKGSAATPAVPEMIEISVSSKPSGAEIFVNGRDQNIKTNATLQLKRSKDPAIITLKLKNYEELTIDNVALDGAPVKQDVTLKKIGGGTVAVPHVGGGSGTGKGSGSGPAPGTGSGSSTVRKCDTCLERPD